jgi:nitrous-oxide reductase
LKCRRANWTTTTSSPAAAIPAKRGSTALPSGRTIKRIPVFNIDPMVGWGITNESKKIIGTKPDGSLKYITGDTHHIHGSYTDGTYDGKYLWINDKIHGRLARIRMDYMECDKITELPNIQGFHGLFPDKRDPVDPKINHHPRVLRRRVPYTAAQRRPGHGRSQEMGLPVYLRGCRDHGVRWQCKLSGNMDLVATSYDGKLAAANQYNTEGGAIYTDMMSAERDAVVFFNIERIEAAIKAGKFITIGDSKVPVVDGTKDANPDPKTALVLLCAGAQEPARRQHHPRR